MAIDRRHLLRGALGGGALAPLVLPEQWSKPVVQALVVPAHAAASPAITTIAPTTTPLEFPSDIRLKRDIVRVGSLTNGLGLYRYRYIWGDQIFVGVMAREVMNVRPDAVVVGAGGFMSVDYHLLGLRLMTADEWELEAGGAISPPRETVAAA